MSAQGSSKHGPYRKPQADIYTVMLILTLLAIIVGCVYLYLEVADYPDKPPWSGATKAAWLGPDRNAGPSVAVRQTPPACGEPYLFPPSWVT